MSTNGFLATAATLVRGGYSVIPLGYAEKRPTGDGWVDTITTLESLRSWPERGNIGVLTARTPAVDLDIKDAEFCERFELWVLKQVGDAPVRVGLAPKRLLVFRTLEPFRKVQSRAWIDAKGETHRVEVLGQGQQFVAFGVHPDTRKPYRWITEEDPRTLAVDDLPLIDRDAAATIVAEFERRAEAAGWKPKGPKQLAGAAEDDDLDFLRPKPDLDGEELRRVVELFENPGRDYDLWIKVGAALHHQTDGHPDGLELWHEWSSRSPLYDARACDSKWSSFGRYQGRKTTVAFLLAETRDARRTAERAEKTAETQDQRAAIRTAIEAAGTGDTLLDNVLPLIADAKLDTVTEQVLLGEIANKHKALAGAKPTAWALARRVKELRSQRSENPASPLEIIKLEYDLAGRVLADHYADGAHLKTFSKLWWEYRGGVWSRTEESAIKARVQSTILGLVNAEDEALKTLISAVVESRGDRLSALVNTIFATIDSRVAEDGNDDPLALSANRVSMVVNCQNAELWFNDEAVMKVGRHSPKHLLTSQIGCAYDAKAECPTWDDAIRKVFKACQEPEAVIRHFEEVMGYILQPTRHQAVWAMLKGPGGNGKSFLLAVISTLMGPQAVIGASINDLAQGVSPHFTDSLQGKLMLLDDDLKAGTLLPDDWLKKLSEAKLITANPKFGRPYNFTARSIPVILTNSWPSTVDLSDGLRRRAMIFASDHVLTEDEKDPRHFKQILEHELPGVLNRLVAGFRRFLARGQRFDVPAECEAAVQEWLAQSNPTALFASKALEATGDRADHVQGHRLYDAYLNWARHWEHNIRELGRNKFYEALFKLGFKRVMHGNVTTFSGVRLRNVEGTEDLFLDISSDDPNQGL